MIRAAPLAPPLARPPRPPRRRLGGAVGVRRAGLALLAALALFAIVLPPFLPDPNIQHYEAILAGSSPTHPLGTDVLGRDLLSRLAGGARISLLVALGSQALALTLGGLLGGVAAIGGGRTDALSMRLADTVLAFPALVLVVLLQSVWVGGLPALIVVIGLTTWPLYARLARAQMLATIDAEYVVAARAAGAGPARLLRSHLLPAARPALTVAVAFAIPQAVFLEASLGFLGLGVAPPTATWGGLIRDGYDVILIRPLPILAPVAAVTLLALAATLIGAGGPGTSPPAQAPRG